MDTTSVYPSTIAVEPSPNLRRKLLPVSDALWLSDGSYKAWPEQVSPQSGPGKNRSLLPESKSTAVHQLAIRREKGEAHQGTSSRGCLRKSTHTTIAGRPVKAE